MTTRHLPGCPSFVDWYFAIHQRNPFPWQNRLANQLAAGHGWPRLVGIPTGLGKTACIDIAIWSLAYQADLEPAERTAPTRLWWVVNRRLLVDSTYEHAERVAQRLADTPDGPVAAIASRLGHVGGRATGAGSPLEVIHLRGGGRSETNQQARVRRRQRPSTPAQPAVICSTIPMFGSRVLFRGYGTSRSMRPVDAALAYTDSLVIIDEAHLATHLQQLLRDLAPLDSGDLATLPEVRRSPVVVALTATGDPDTDRFDLNSEDHDHPVIKQRVNAKKPVLIKKLNKATTPSKITVGMESVVRDLILSSDPAVSLVFVNSPSRARSLAQRLHTVRNADVVVATGQIRGYEAAKVTRDIIGQAGADRDRIVRTRHLIIVATQTLEVGADIDADYMVTEACGVRALTQRLGRLNRFGKRPHANGIYLHTPGKKGIWPVYGKEPATVLARLENCVDEEGVVNLPPGTIRGVLGDPQDIPDPAPVVAAGILWEWIKTTTPIPGEAPVDPYFSGFDDLQRHVTVAWRAHLPGPTERIWPKLRADETVDVLVSEAVEALERLDDRDRWTLVDSRHRGATLGSPRDLTPGSTILVHPDVGLLDRDGHWDPRASDLVRDVSILRSGLPVAPGLLHRIYGETPPEGAEQAVRAIGVARENDDAERSEEECHRLVTALRTPAPPWIDNPAEWDDFIADLSIGLAERVRAVQPVLVEHPDEVPRLPMPHPNTLTQLTIHSDDDDELSLQYGNNDPSTLSGHGDHTAAVAARVLAAVGISESLSRIVIQAARLHDIGKADSRFQTWLCPNWTRHDALRAKSGLPRSAWSGNRARAGWPQGGRHEELSRRLVEAWLGNTHHDLDPYESDLLQHLIVSHHGRGRPLVLPVRDRTTGNFLRYTVLGITVTVSPDLETPDWLHPRRFARLNHRYGPWELALLETIVRQSDHIASSVLEVQ